MDDNVRLSQALRSIVSGKQTTTASGRLIFSTGDGDGVPAILQEVSETILRRVLSFSNDRGETIFLDVAERRVMTLLSSATSQKGETSDLFDRVLSAQDAPRVAKILADFARDTQSLRVVSELPNSASMGAVIGLSIRDLVKVSGDQCAAGGSPVEELAIQLREFAVAIYSEVDELPEIWGDEALTQKLATLHASIPVSEGMTTEESLWGGGLVEGAIVLRLVHDGAQIFAVLPQERLDAYLAFRVHA